MAAKTPYRVLMDYREAVDTWYSKHGRNYNPSLKEFLEVLEAGEAIAKELAESKEGRLSNFWLMK